MKQYPQLEEKNPREEYCKLEKWKYIFQLEKGKYSNQKKENIPVRKRKKYSNQENEN